jgi:hypothetical protein
MALSIPEMTATVAYRRNASIFLGERLRMQESAKQVSNVEISIIS